MRLILTSIDPSTKDNTFIKCQVFYFTFSQSMSKYSFRIKQKWNFYKVCFLGFMSYGVAFYFQQSKNFNQSLSDDDSACAKTFKTLISNPCSVSCSYILLMTFALFQTFCVGFLMTSTVDKTKWILFWKVLFLCEEVKLQLLMIIIRKKKERWKNSSQWWS